MGRATPAPPGPFNEREFIVAKFVMAHEMSGTIDGVDWPKPGRPIPTGLPKAEVDHLLAAGIIREAGPEVETATARGDVENATVATRRRKG